MCVLIVPVMMITTLMMPNDHGSASSCFGFILFVVMMIFYVTLAVVLMVVLTPLILRASLTQEFAAAFNVTFLKRFIALNWKETILSALFLLAVGLALGALDALALCIGMYFAMVPVYFCMVHLQKQLYRLYLDRGGEPVPVSPKLRDDLAPATI